MLTQEPSTNQKGLEKAIDKLLLAMDKIENNTPEYTMMVERLERLYKLKAIDAPRRVSPDAIATVAANLVGILLIIGYEHANVVTSKALNFVMKLR